jgi:hypothetical protein
LTLAPGLTLSATKVSKVFGVPCLLPLGSRYDMFYLCFPLTDHIAQIQELVGRFPNKIACSGRYWKQFFTKKGVLKHIKDLRFWGMADILVSKYSIKRDVAALVESFILPCLNVNPGKKKRPDSIHLFFFSSLTSFGNRPHPLLHAARRATAADCLRHPWMLPSAC